MKWKERLMWKACYSFFKLSHANTLSTVVLGSINRPLKSSTLLRRQTKEKIKTNGKVEQKDRLTTSIRNGRNENRKRKTAQPREILVKCCYFNGSLFTGSENKKMMEWESFIYALPDFTDKSKVFAIFRWWRSDRVGPFSPWLAVSTLTMLFV